MLVIIDGTYTIIFILYKILMTVTCISKQQ